MTSEELKINSLDYWKAEIRMGVRYRQVFGRSTEWAGYKRMYRGFWGKEVVPVNIIYAIGRSLIPQVYFRNPRIGVSAKKPGYALHALVLEQIDNYLIRETALKQELKSSVLDCYLMGRGPGILGYDSEYGYNPSFLASEFSEGYKTRLDSSVEGKPEGNIRGYEDDAKNEWVEIFEIHDKRSGNVMVLSVDCEKWLRRPEMDFLQVEGLPAEVLGFNEDPDYFWWTPDCRLINVQQAELNDIRTMAKKHRRVALLKVLYDKGMLGKDALSKLLDEDPKAAVEIDAGANGDVRKAVALFQSHVPPDLLSAAREVREDIREVVGFSRNQMGSFEDSSGRRTATEASIVKAASMIRIDERRDIMADYLERVIRKENQLIFSNWSTERIIDIIGLEGARYWVRFTGEEIKGEFTYKINPEESVPEDRRTQRAEIMEFLQVAAQAPGIDVQYLLQSYASKLGDWLDPKMLFPREGAGASPEKAMQFTDFMRMYGNAASRFPGLAL